MCDQDIELRRKRDLERYHRQTAERKAKGLCVTCGKVPPEPGRTRCEPCAAKRRPADRARHHKRTAERVARGMCPKCGKRPPARGAAGRRHWPPLAQDYAGEIEIVVADGSDRPDMAEAVRTRFPGVRIVPNPDRGISAGLNRALRAATHDIVLRCDARCLLPPHYVRMAVATLRRTAPRRGPPAAAPPRRGRG